MTAKSDVLRSLHEAVATDLLNKVKNGTATPAEISTAVKFLKDNGIECIATPDNPLGALADTLPVFNDDDYKGAH